MYILRAAILIFALFLPAIPVSAQTLPLAVSEGGTGTRAVRSGWFLTGASDLQLAAQEFIDLASDMTGILGIANGGTGISTAPSLGQILVGNATGGFDYVASSSLVDSWTKNGSNLQYAKGNVGIGTTSPSAKLSIAGSAGTGDLFVIASPANTRFLTVSSAGKLGLGTSNPTDTLDVDGRVAIGNKANANNIGKYNSMLDISNAFTETSGDNIYGTHSKVWYEPSSPLKQNMAVRGAISKVVWNSNQNAKTPFKAVLIGGMNEAVTSDANGGASGDLGQLTANYAKAAHYGTGTIGELYGVYSSVTNDDLFSEAGNISAMYNFRALASSKKGTGTVDVRYGLYVDNVTGGGNTTSNYGIRIAPLTGGRTANIALRIDGASGGTTNRAIQVDSGVSTFGGNVGIGTTSPMHKLSVAGTVGFSSLTVSAGAGSLCLSSLGEVVYNAGSDNCLSSTRETKHAIGSLALSELEMLQDLRPVSFVYNGDPKERIRYGFIADEASSVDPRLATRNAEGKLTGLDTSAFLALVVGAVQELGLEVANLAHVFRTERVETETLCIGSLCLTESEVRQILESQHVDPALDLLPEPALEESIVVMPAEPEAPAVEPASEPAPAL